MKFPIINEDKCPTKAAQQCPDGSDPTILPPSLLLKPSTALVCSTDGTLQFSTFLRSGAGEVELTSGVTYSSSNSGAVSINPVTGLATILGAGIVTISAQWQGTFAYAQVTVLGGPNCCDDVSIGTLLVVDRSLSMSLPFGGAYATLLDAAKAIALADVSALLAKDTMGVEQFASVAELLLGLTSDTVALSAAISGITIDPAPAAGGDTNIPDALTLAIETLNACVTCDRRVIVLFSDGKNRPVLGTTAYNEMLTTANMFKAAGGLIICVGIRAAGDGYALLQQLASGGFFINAIDQVDSAISALLCLLGYYCAGTRPPEGYGYTCSGYNCCDEPPGEQPVDPSPLYDIELGETGAFTSTKEACASCPPGTGNEALVGLIPLMTGPSTPSGVASASSEEDLSTAPCPSRPAWTAFGVACAGWVSKFVEFPPQWIQYDFGPSGAVEAKSWTAALYHSGHYRLDGSNDGTTWDVLDDRALIIAADYPLQGVQFKIASPGSYRYYRWNCLTIVDSGTAHNFQIRNLQLFENIPGQACATMTATSEISQEDADAKATASATAKAQSMLDCHGPDNTLSNAIKDRAPAALYPSRKLIAGMGGLIVDVVVRIRKLTHTAPGDIQLVLQSPAGTTCLLMWNAGGTFSISNVDLQFQDSNPDSLPEDAVIPSGSYKPTAYPAIPSLFAPGPTTPYGVTLSVFAGENPNGMWKLWVCDQQFVDVGVMAGGWDVIPQTA